MIREQTHIQSSTDTTHLPVTIELLPYEEKATAARWWQELEQRTDNTRLTNSWLWTKIWLDHHGHVLHPTFVFGRQDGQIIGATVVVSESYKRKSLPLPITHIYIGTGEYTKYNRILAAPGYEDSFAEAMLQALQRKCRWSELRFDGMDPHDAEVLLRASRKVGLAFEVTSGKAPAFDFRKADEEGHKDVISALSSNTRYNLRRSMRLFVKAYGELSLEWSETPEQAREILEELIELNRVRWNSFNQGGSFDQAYIVSYHKSLIDEVGIWPQGSVILCRVKAGEKTLGCVFHFVAQGHLFFSKSGMLLSEDAKLKPGLVTHLLCMEECKKRSLAAQQQGDVGILIYDFLTGEGSLQYKDSLSNQEGSLESAITERGLLLGLLRSAGNIKRMLKRR